MIASKNTKKNSQSVTNNDHDEEKTLATKKISSTETIVEPEKKEDTIVGYNVNNIGYFSKKIRRKESIGEPKIGVDTNVGSNVKNKEYSSTCDPPIIIHPGQINPPQATDYKISLNDFISTTSEAAPFCHIANEEHPEQLVKLFQNIFGLNTTSITNGLDLTDDKKNALLDFVSMDINNKLYGELKSPSVEYQHLFSVSDLTVGFECLETIAMKRNDGWLNDEARNIFIDSVNILLFVCLRKKVIF